MPFDPRAQIHPFEDEAAWSAWLGELVERFAEAPEVDALPPEVGVTWSGMMLQYAADYERASLATLTPGTLEFVLLELFPRKVAVGPEEAGAIVRELRAFFAFVDREFGLGNAKRCAAVLVPELEARLEAALADTSRFGMAKSFFVGGADAGFDMSSQDGIDAWASLQNAQAAELFARRSEQRPAPPGKTPAERKAARKRQQKARRKNRR